MVKSLSLERFNEEWLNKLSVGLAEAAKTQSYVETVLPSQADTLHKSIKWIDVKTIIQEFEAIVRKSLKTVNLEGKHVKVGCDVTEDLTWTENGRFNTRPSTHKSQHHIQSWQYLNISITKPFFLPLMSIPYRQIDDLDLLVIRLLEFLESLPIIVDLILFDKGFYHAYLIDYMQNPRRKKLWPYLMSVRKTEAVKEYVDQTEIFDSFVHELECRRNKSKWYTKTTIVVWKPDPEVYPDVAWSYATNQQPSIELLNQYPKRWGHETEFRVHDEAGIKSKSSHPLIRFFYHIVGMLLIILWRTQSLLSGHIVFKRFLKAVEHRYLALTRTFKPPPRIYIF